jgi:DNA-binding MarR family transcriptional regulator
MSLQQELGFPNPIEDLEHEAVISIVLTGQMLAKEGDRLLRPLGLTDSQFNILILLKYQVQGGEINQTQLGQMLLVNRSNVTGLVDRMEQAGWIERVGEARDRRVKRVRMTSAGRKLTDRAENVYFDRIHQVMSALTSAENRQLCQLLERLRERLKHPA